MEEKNCVQVLGEFLFVFIYFMSCVCVIFWVFEFIKKRGGGSRIIHFEVNYILI